jgi:hypothetical protein
MDEQIYSDSDYRQLMDEKSELAEKITRLEKVNAELAEVLELAKITLYGYYSYNAEEKCGVIMKIENALASARKQA